MLINDILNNNCSLNVRNLPYHYNNINGINRKLLHKEVFSKKIHCILENCHKSCAVNTGVTQFIRHEGNTEYIAFFLLSLAAPLNLGQDPAHRENCHLRKTHFITVRIMRTFISVLLLMLVKTWISCHSFCQGTLSPYWGTQGLNIFNLKSWGGKRQIGLVNHPMHIPEITVVGTNMPVVEGTVGSMCSPMK